MPSIQFRIEGHPTANPGSAWGQLPSRWPHRLLQEPDLNRLYNNCSLAVAVAVKSVADPSCQHVRVVCVPSGEVVFET